VPAGTHEHTLHRLAATFEALAAEVPLVLVVEDVQWSDYSTLDFLSVLARRREPARLLVLCTLRPAEAIVRVHPVAGVQRELRRQGLCREILLDGLSAAEVAKYLVARFGGADVPGDLLPLLVERSDGNPFFLGVLVQHLLDAQLLVGAGTGWQLRQQIETLRTAIPEGLRAVIEPRLERLAADEQLLLETACVAGAEFAAHVIARAARARSGLGDVERVEQLCDDLVRRQEILRATGERAGPDGIVSAHYAFRHALYQQVIYQRLSSSTRRRLHRTIGESLEAAHGGSPGEAAAELAAHFERCGDVERAVHYHGAAAANARARFSYREAVLHLEAAIAGLEAQPESAERLGREMPLLHELGSALFAIKGYGDQSAAHVFARMRGLAERLDSVPMRLRAMDGLLLAHMMRAELATARTLGEDMLALAERLGDQVAAANARVMLGATLLNLGELETAREHAERVRSLLDGEGPPVPTVFGVSSCCLLAAAYAHLGLVGKVQTMQDEALARGARLGVPYFRAHATNFAAQICALLGDVARARSLAEETVRLATEYGFSVFRIAARMVRGWCDVEEGHVADGLAALRGGFEEYATTGQRIGTTGFSLLLARAQLVGGEVEQAVAVVDAALAFAAETGERLYEHELYRLRGECALADGASSSRTAEAAAWFERALAIAAERKARLFELRAAVSLCRIGRRPARERLARLVARFDAADDCADLRAARAVLGQRE
jgi:tetratricopeptide (TPR) repeat protein